MSAQVAMQLDTLIAQMQFPVDERAHVLQYARLAGAAAGVASTAAFATHMSYITTARLGLRAPDNQHMFEARTHKILVQTSCYIAQDTREAELLHLYTAAYQKSITPVRGSVVSFACLLQHAHTQRCIMKAASETFLAAKCARDQHMDSLVTELLDVARMYSTTERKQITAYRDSLVAQLKQLQENIKKEKNAAKTMLVLNNQVSMLHAVQALSMLKNTEAPL